MALGDYLLSAPSPPVKEDPEATAARAIEAIASAQSSDEIVAAVNNAFTAFAGVTEARLHGEPFNPISWGYTRTAIFFDGQTVNADIQFLPTGTIAGQTINAQGTPIGAEVTLRGLGPNKIAAPDLIVRAKGYSDPATGMFQFPNSALAGDFSLTTTTPLIPHTVVKRGVTSTVATNSLTNILQFPSIAETSGRLTGVANHTTVVLFDKGGLLIDVILANGAPATNADLIVTQGGFPHCRCRTAASGGLHADEQRNPG
jgi:hypothetical protein